MANLSSADPIYDEAGPSYDSDILSEVQDHDNYQDTVGEYHEVHEMHNDVQPNYIVDSDAEYTSDTNIISIIITDRNIKEESLKKELHYVKMQLNSTIGHNKSMREEVATWKKYFKQKENKYLEDFLDMKALKEKVEDKLFKQDQSLQTVHMLCKPKPYYDEKKKVAIGYKNPLYLTKAMQVQCALYNGHEIVKTKHIPTVVHDSEDTLEIVEKTRIGMLEKMKSTLWVDSKIKIAHQITQKRIILLLLPPQRHLTPKQIFWSSDIAKMTLKPIPKMTVYPPDTTKRLVPRVLPTKSQVKINIYTLTQLFAKFEKTCKKRITPCGLTEGERGFKQRKECYLTEVIPFFKTLKEHFEGIKMALVKEVKKIKEIFEQMESEVEQKSVDKQCKDIERKRLLIENENLIVDFLSYELLYSVMNDVNIVSRFSKMHYAYTVEHARCLEHEDEISKIKHKIQKDDHNEMIKHFSNLEGAPRFDTVFEINKMKESLQGKDNTIRNLKGQISQMNERRSEADPILDFKALVSQSKDLTEKVTALQDLNEHFRAKNEKVKQHYKELYDSIKITRAKTIDKTTSLLTKIENLKAQIKGKMKCVTKPAEKSKVLAPGMYAIYIEPIPPRNRNNREVHLDYLKHFNESVETLREIVEEARIEKPLDNALKMPQTSVPVIPSTGVISSTKASRSKPRSVAKNSRYLIAKSDNKKKVEDHPRNNKSNLKQENRVDSSISYKHTIMSPRIRTQSVGRPVAESRGGATGVQVGRGGRGRGPREGNDESVDDLNGQGNDQGMGANGGVEGVNGNVEGVNGGVGGAPDFSTIIAQQLQNLLPTILAQVGNQGNVGNQNGNVVNENIQENVRNVLMNSNRVGCSYKEFLACNPKEYDGKRGSIVLTRWIEKMEFVQDMSGCSVDQKVKYTAGLRDDKKPSCHERMIRRVRKDEHRGRRFLKVGGMLMAVDGWMGRNADIKDGVSVKYSTPMLYSVAYRSLGVLHSMPWNDFMFMMIEEFCPSHEMQKLETGLWNHAMVRAGHTAYTDRLHELAS
ncbi:hypothetical protein Tco_1004670 [Tanacetum coccineum]|uniref:Reverse transcriptase domain-containing protein n=1 Tax=Tanacetum coccineum TaxID=301880 RepID=A0ABQ5FEG6_9ASTR